MAARFFGGDATDPRKKKKKKQITKQPKLIRTPGGDFSDPSTYMTPIESQPPQEEKPTENKRQTIRNADGSVTEITPGGKRQDFTRKEYEQYTKGLKGEITQDLPGLPENVKGALDIAESNRLARQLLQGGVMQGGTIAGLPGMAGGQLPIGANGQIPSQFQPMGAFQGGLPQEQQQITSFSAGINDPMLQALKFEALNNPDISTSERALRLGETYSKNAFAAASSFKAFASGSDTTIVKNIKGDFAGAKTAMEKQITATGAGFGNEAELLENYDTMVKAIEQLEAQTTRRGLDNLPYWLSLRDEGLQGEIKSYKLQLASMKLDIDRAIEAGNRARQQMYLQDLQIKQYQELTKLR